MILKYHFCSNITQFKVVSIIVRCGIIPLVYRIPYTQWNHIDNIITNSCKLIFNIPGSGIKLEFHLVSQDIYLMVKWFGLYCLIFRPILYKKRWRFATTSYVISLTVPSLSQFIIFTSLLRVIRDLLVTKVTPYYPNVQ